MMNKLRKTMTYPNRPKPRVSRLFLGFGLFFILFGGLAPNTAEAKTLMAIDVTPANPTVNVGNSVVFTAIGIYDDASTGPIPSATGVSTGDFSSCSVLSDGKVRCWGDNFYGQLGDGTFVNSNIPVTVEGINTAAAITTGFWHACGLISDGTIECWGDNVVGQLGVEQFGGGDPVTESPIPLTVTGITTAIAVVSSYAHTCAVLSAGTLECWGYNNYGQLGDGSTLYSDVPLPVGSLSSVAAVGIGYFHTCAVLSDGTIECWGLNDYGQLGNGSLSDSLYPVPVSGITNAVGVSAGQRHTCALLADGGVQCWGENTYGQLGNGTMLNSSSPVNVTGILTAISVNLGGLRSCATIANGTLQCWGDNFYGALGDGTTNDSPVPVTVSGITSAVAVSGGFDQTCAVVEDGAAFCWGINEAGQLGTGSYDISLTPTDVFGIGAHWSTSDSSVATVDSYGTAAGIAAGTATISATSGSVTGSTSITVVNPTSCIGIGSSSIKGHVKTPKNIKGASLTIAGKGGSCSDTIGTDSKGRYEFSGLADGSYSVTPSLAGMIFSPSSRSVDITGKDVRKIDFEGKPAP